MSITHVGTKILETERLTLRRFQYNDNCSMRKHWVSDPYIQKMYSEPVYSTEAETHELLKKYIEAYKNNAYRWAIVLARRKRVHRPDSLLYGKRK